MSRAVPVRRRREDLPLMEPRRGGNVWPRQTCPAFTPRTAAGPVDRECWFCKYADFHLTAPTALDVGVCCWPKVQMD